MQTATKPYDAVVVGSGPNGFSAAITLGEKGKRVLILEASSTIGGGTRSGEILKPGFVHDICSAVHPMGVASPFFDARGPKLNEYGLDWVFPEIPVAHPLPGGTVAVGYQDLATCAEHLGADGKAYEKLLRPLVDHARDLYDDLLGPLPLFPKNPLKLAKFGWHARRSAAGLAEAHFSTPEARALLAGHSAHSILPLTRPLTAAVGLMLAASSHAVGWPFAKGGSQAIADAMKAYFVEELNGEVATDSLVTSLEDIPPCKTIIFDTSPQAMADIVGDKFNDSFSAQLENYRFGPAAFKLDLILSEPIPWKNAECHRAGTVHVGGALETVIESEAAIWENRVSEEPFTLVAQASRFDRTRLPEGSQEEVAWIYCHVPHNWEGDCEKAMIQHVEKYAPGFSSTILQSQKTTPKDLYQYNPNYLGGDIIGGVQDWKQLFTRPTRRLKPHTTPVPHIFIASASTPPGAGVHGMCGWHAAQGALKQLQKET